MSGPEDYTVAGFRFAGARGGIKQKDGLDVGLIVADRPAATAAIFTRNRVKAAPVLVSQDALRGGRGRTRAIVVSSGNANACTGARGMSDARTMQALAAAVADADAGEVLVASTGVIGQPLPMDRVEAGIAAAGAGLAADGFGRFAEAILTTDRRAKVARREAGQATLIGCTKGAGMIMPNMATTLTFVATDAAIGPADLREALGHAADRTYNRIAVDGDTSTNDMIAAMASGAAKVKRGAFRDALVELLDDLAAQLMTDGEGVHHVVTVRVRGAAGKKAARAIAQRIAISPLVKTAIAGGDPNWGRVLCAAGNAGVPLEPRRLALWIAGVPVCADGVVADGFDEARAAAAMKADRYEIVLDLGMGAAEAEYLACDLSHEYVNINADYRT